MTLQSLSNYKKIFKLTINLTYNNFKKNYSSLNTKNNNMFKLEINLSTFCKQNVIKRYYRPKNHAMSIYLTKKINYNFVEKKHMLSVGKVLKGTEKESVAKILHLTKSLLKKKPFDDNDIFNLTVQALIISPPIAQHFFAVTFPKYKMPLSLLFKKLPRVSFETSTQTEIGWDQINSACTMIHRDNNPLLKDGKLISLSNRKMGLNSVPRTSQAYQNTGQEEPDYLYKCIREKTGEIYWIRYYDWKTGEIGPNSGSILGTSDPDKFNDLSEILLKRQQKFYFDEPLLGPYLKELVEKQTNLTWSEKNFCFQNFLKENMQNLDPTINPSIIFKTTQFANAERTWKSSKYKFIEGSLKTDCFNNKANSEITIAKILVLDEKAPNLIDNFKQTKGHSTKIADICKNLWTDYL